jgi:hypothetical protein
VLGQTSQARGLLEPCALRAQPVHARAFGQLQQPRLDRAGRDERGLDDPADVGGAEVADVAQVDRGDAASADATGRIIQKGGGSLAGMEEFRRRTLRSGALMNDEHQSGHGSGATELEKVVSACASRLRDPAEWTAIPGYPDSLALAMIDAIWSTGTHYAITRRVIGRYRSRRAQDGSDVTQDSLTDLLGLYERLGGVDEFINQIGTKNRVSTQPNAVRKGEAVHLAAMLLADLGINTAAKFRDTDGTGLGGRAQEEWLTLPGQGSGISWRYLRMLLQLPDVKPDRMVTRFIACALGVDENAVDQGTAVRLVRAAAEHFGVDQRALDHEIWQYYQSGYPRSTTL